MMDDQELRAALGQRIAEEVDAQFSQYRGAVSARLSVLSTEMETAMKQLDADDRSQGQNRSLNPGRRNSQRSSRAGKT